MSRFYLAFFLIAFFVRCGVDSRKDHQPQVIKAESDQNVIAKTDSIKVYGYATNDSIFVTKDELINGRYLMEYENSLSLDTVIISEDYNIRILHKIDTLRSYLFPERYAWDSALNGTRIYYSHTEILYKNARTGKRDTIVINEETFYPFLVGGAEQLKQYGVLLGLQIERVDKINARLELSYSYSIPFSDIGVAVGAWVSLRDRQVILKKQ